MASIPKGALLQKAANGVSYVYFPSYFYDKNATTHNKEKQKRLYIGKVKDDVCFATIRIPHLRQEKIPSTVTSEY